MYYKYEIEYYEEDGLYVVSGIVYANCYANALDKIDNAYDASTLTKITIVREQDNECLEFNCYRKEND